MTNKILHSLWLYSVTSVAAEQIDITSPISGWRDSSGSKVQFMQKVNYPAVKVTVPVGQSHDGRIEGQIRHQITTTPKPYTLVVNGVGMPVRVSGGHFSRPYKFAAGTNSVEVISPEGKARAQTQFYETNASGTPSRIKVILSWDSDNTDIDLHVVTPEGEHCFYGNRRLADGSALDVDVTSGYGPEIFSSPGSVKGPYLIYVNYFGRASTQEITMVTVTMITAEGTIDEKIETKRVPLRHPGELTYISSFLYH